MDQASNKTDLRVKINGKKARTLGILTLGYRRTVRLAIAGLTVALFTDENSDDYNIVVGGARENSLR